MTAYPPQPDTLAVEQAVAMLRQCVTTLLGAAADLEQAPKKSKRVALKQALSGVLADVEVVRVSIRE